MKQVWFHVHVVQFLKRASIKPRWQCGEPLQEPQPEVSRYIKRNPHFTVHQIKFLEKRI